MSNDELQPASNQQIQETKEYQRRGNRNGLIFFIVLILLIGGCGYALKKWSDSYGESGKAYGGSHPSDSTH